MSEYKEQEFSEKSSHIFFSRKSSLVIFGKASGSFLGKSSHMVVLQEILVTIGSFSEKKNQVTL